MRGVDRCARQRRPAVIVPRRACGCGGPWLGLLRLLLLLLLGRLAPRRLLRLWHEEILPGEQHADRQHDGEDEIAVILVHVAFARGRGLRGPWRGR